MEHLWNSELAQIVAGSHRPRGLASQRKAVFKRNLSAVLNVDKSKARSRAASMEKTFRSIVYNENIAEIAQHFEM